MKTRLVEVSRALALSLGALSFVSGVAGAADPLTDSLARTIVAPFYHALSSASGKLVPALVMQSTSPEWISCRNNDECGPRDKVIDAIAAIHEAIPNLTWEIKELLVAGNTVIVRGEASGTPNGEFKGVPHGGKSFRVMSIDIHVIEGDKMKRSYHVEDWLGATRQISAK